ncbi:MAG: tetratricopeptide repeat protein, partial [Gammaproteobacteria bacterium]|nr:tetratricopeptide repeat protein [Gammaproteobacteria bacterium]
ALTREGRLQDALPFAERGVELYEQNAELQGTMGYLLAMADRFPDALPYLQRKVELRPDDAHARANLAVALKRLDRSEEAREMGESALELEPAQPTAHAIMAALCRERGDFERALGHFEKALERKPDNGSVLFGLYGIKKDVSEEDDVAAILATLAAKETITAEELVQYNFTLANIFDRLKSPERAIFYYKAANDLR